MRILVSYLELEENELVWSYRDDSKFFLNPEHSLSAWIYDAKERMAYLNRNESHYSGFVILKINGANGAILHIQTTEE